MNNQHIGRFQEIGIALEAERGVAEDSPEKTIQKLEADFYKSVEKEADLSTRAVLADNQKLDKVSEVVDGSCNMRVHVDTLGYFFKNIFGDVTTTEYEYEDGETTTPLEVYEHNFTVDETITRPTFSVFYAEGNVEDGVIPGSVVDEITINADADGLVTADISLLGKTTEDKSFSFSYDEEYDFVGRDISIAKADTLAQVDTSNPLDVKEMDITFDTGGVSDFTMDGSYGPADIYQNDQIITGSLVLNYDENEWKDYYDGNDSFAMVIKIESTKNIQDVDPEADDYFPTIEIELPKVFVEDWDRDSSNNDVIQQEISFKASFDHDNDTIANGKIINNTENYNA